MTTIIIVILIFLLLGLLPQWGWHGGGPWPSGIIGLIIAILLILWLAGRLPF